ncbi:uncharacterized protein [Palaemon carinicauda]|uniref:uncharacterized protein n=1 Tax=Palaemon carinicauda TaxID=392227 RepID=UPI0035B64521
MKPRISLLSLLGLLTVSQGLKLVPTNVNNIPTVTLTKENTAALATFIGLGISVIIGYKNLLNPKPKPGKRSITNSTNIDGLYDDIEAAMDTIFRMDTFGCVRRTVCLLAKKEPGELVQEATDVIELFSAFPVEVVASEDANSSSPAVYAEGDSCEERLVNCPLDDQQLEELFDFSVALTSGSVLFS